MVKLDFKWFLLRWLTGFAYVIDGLLLICSLGFLQTGLSYEADRAFLDHITLFMDMDDEEDIHLGC